MVNKKCYDLTWIELTCYECFPQWRTFIWSLWNYFKEIISHEQNGVWTVAPEENFPPNNYPRGQLLLNYCSPTITPKIIAPWQYTPGNCPRGKLTFGWFMAYIVAPRTNGPEENYPVGKLHSRYFSPRIRNCSTLTDSCFLLFSFFVV